MVVRQTARCPAVLALVPPALLTVLATLSIDAQGAPPLATDDAATLEPGACQFELERRRFGKHTELDLLPACNLFLDAELAIGKQRFSGDGGYRLDSNVYQIKKVLLPAAASPWGFGISAATVRSSMRSAEQVSAMRQDQVNALFTRQLAAATLHANVGLVRDSAAQDGQLQSRYTWALAAEHEASPRWTVVCDMFGQRKVPRSSQAGVRWWAVPKYMQLTTSLGTQRGQGRDGRWASFGLRFETGGPVF